MTGAAASSPLLELLARMTAGLENFIAPTQSAQRLDRRLDHVGVIARAERLREHVANAGRFDDRAHAAAGDDAGAGRSRAQQNAAAAELADHFVRNRVLAQRHFFHRLCGPIRRPCESLRRLRSPCRSRQPTLPSWSPATISALKLKRRPPLTTLAQRLMKTTFSVVSPLAGGVRSVVRESLRLPWLPAVCHDIKTRVRLRGPRRPGLSLCRGRESRRDRKRPCRPSCASSARRSALPTLSAVARLARRLSVAETPSPSCPAEARVLPASSSMTCA